MNFPSIRLPRGQAQVFRVSTSGSPAGRDESKRQHRQWVSLDELPPPDVIDCYPPSSGSPKGAPVRQPPPSQPCLAQVDMGTTSAGEPPQEASSQRVPGRPCAQVATVWLTLGRERQRPMKYGLPSDSSCVWSGLRSYNYISLYYLC